MINDINILSVLKNRTDYERYSPFVRDNLLTKEGDIICKYLSKFYDKYASVDDLEWSSFGSYFFVMHPTMDASNKKIYTHIFTELDEYDESVDHSVVMNELVRKTYATQIAEKCLKIADGKDDDPLDVVEELLDSAKEEAGNYAEEDSSLSTFTYEELFDESDDPKLQFSLQELREACGGIQKGDFVVVGAHPDTGKSTFLYDQMIHMTTQLPDGKKAILFNNEQKVKAVNYRIISRIIGRSTQDIELDPVDALHEFDKSPQKDKFIVYDKSGMTDRFVVDKLKKHSEEVGLILFDQLWKINMLKLKSNNEFMALGKQYAWGRDVAKRYAPVITVHQLDGASKEMKYIDMQSMFGSKVALQGEADMIINIGRITDGSEPHNIRHFYVPKNKIVGADPTKTNNKFDAYINHDVCKFEDIT